MKKVIDLFLKAQKILRLIRSVRAAFFLALVLFISPSFSAQAADWELVSHAGQDYVTLSSFCNFYKIPYEHPEGNVFRAQNNFHTIELVRDSRDAKIDGIRFWLSFGVLEIGHDWLISRLDLVKLFEPIMRPQSIDSKRTIQGVVIDPGHGGFDMGATNNRGKMEKVYTLDTALRLKELLRLSGLKVVLTRQSDVFIDLYQRARIAAQYPQYLFVSIHFNSASSEARGLETYACSPRTSSSTQSGGRVSYSDFHALLGNANDTLNILLGYDVQKEIAKLHPGDEEADRGVKRARFVVLKQCTIPGILVEGGFISNPPEAALLDRDVYREKLAEKIAQGIRDFIDQISPNHRRTLMPQAETEQSEEKTPAAQPAYQKRPALVPLIPLTPPKQEQHDSEDEPAPRAVIAKPSSDEVESDATIYNPAPPPKTDSSSSEPDEPTKEP